MGESANLSWQTLNHTTYGESISNSSLAHCAKMVKSGITEVKISIYVVTLVAALIGNSLLIAAFVRMKEPLMLLIANMAASDLLTAIFLLPRLLTIEIVGLPTFVIHGLLGKILCKMCSFLSDTSIAVSSLSSVVIAVERFLAVVYPFKVRHFTTKIRRLLIASTWLVAMAVHAPYLYLMDLVQDESNVASCQSKWLWDNQQALFQYNMFLCLTVLIVPLAVISILYAIILIKLRTNKMAAQRIMKKENRNRFKNLKLLKLALATMLTLLICWTPYTVIYLLELTAQDSLPNCSYSFDMVYFVSILLASCHCAINPLVCFLFLRSFRGQLIVICKYKRRVLHNSKNDLKSQPSRTKARGQTELRQENSRPPGQLDNRTIKKANTLTVKFTYV